MYKGLGMLTTAALLTVASAGTALASHGGPKPATFPPPNCTAGGFDDFYPPFPGGTVIHICADRVVKLAGGIVYADAGFDVIIADGDTTTYTFLGGLRRQGDGVVDATSQSVSGAGEHRFDLASQGNVTCHAAAGYATEFDYVSGQSDAPVDQHTTYQNGLC